MQFTAIGWHYHDGRSVIQHITAENANEAGSIASVCLGRMFVIGSERVGECELKVDEDMGSENENWSVTLINGIVDHIPNSGIGNEIVLPDWNDAEAWGKLIQDECGEVGAKFVSTLVYADGRKTIYETLVSEEGVPLYPYKIATGFPNDREKMYAFHAMENVIYLGEFNRGDADGMDARMKELDCSEYWVFSESELRAKCRDTIAELEVAILDSEKE